MKDLLKVCLDSIYKFTNRLNFEIIVIEASNPEGLNISLSIQDASAYIGEKGRNIGTFETILRLVIKKQLGELPQFHFDINNYRSLREDSLRELAKKAVEQSGLPAGEAGAKGEKEIGKVMSILAPQVKGKADGALVNKIVRELLG